MKDYLRITRSGSYGFIMALPLLLGYEILQICGSNNPMKVRVSAEVLLKMLFNSYSHWGFAGALIIFGIIIFYRERSKELPIKPDYFGYMLGESILWVPIFTITVGLLTQRTQQLASILAAAGPPLTFLDKIGISLGAGVYEEFIFRVCLVGFFSWAGCSLWPKQTLRVYIGAAIISALIFSGVHHMGNMGYPFTWSAFIYRTVAGLVLNALYLTRGFGIAAWTHALYDIVVLLH